MNFPPIALNCIKAYDIRGKLDELTPSVVYRLGRAFAQYLNPAQDPSLVIVVGADVRQSSQSLKDALIDGICDAGTSVMDLGMTGTEEVYFAVPHHHAIGGIEVTASHNPIDYNGLKLVKEDARPVGLETGLNDIKAIAEQGDFKDAPHRGSLCQHTDKSAYIAHLMGYINCQNIAPLKIVVNCGNGAAAPVVDLLEKALHDCGAPVSFVKLHHEPDPTFPNGIPNPMLPQNRTPTSQAVLAHKADFAIAFDGDFDRCFFFDETGGFLDSTYMVGLLAQAFLQKQAGQTIVYDGRCIFSTQHSIAQADGVGVVSKSGHSYIKQTMRKHNAVYGGELSAHHYFRDFHYCDSGMIVWLLVLELVSKTGKSLGQLVGEQMKHYPILGEQNFVLSVHAQDLMDALKDHAHSFDTSTPVIDTQDGLSVCFEHWRFNVRASNTEPLLRLNAESLGDSALLEQKSTQISAWLMAHGATPA